VEVLYALALTFYRQDADGISTYNWLPHRQRGMVPDPMRDNWGDGDKALQMHIHALLADQAAKESYRKASLLLPTRD